MGGGEEGREGERKGGGRELVAESYSVPASRDGIGKGEKVHNVIATLATDAI